MGDLERCTYILCKRDSMGFRGKSQENDSVLKMPNGNIVENNQSHLLVHANLATSLVGCIVKQAVEKILISASDQSKIVQW